MSTLLKLPQINDVGQSPTARLVLAKTLFERGRFREAIDEIGEALAENPELAEGYMLRGLLEFRTGQHESAIESLERALRLDASQVGALFILVQIHLDLLDAENALSVADRMIAQEPTGPRGHYAKGEALLLAQRREEAADAFQEAVRLQPMESQSRLKLGMVLIELGRDDEAFQHMVAAQRSNPANFNGRIVLGDLLAERGQYTEALREYRAASDLQLLHPVPLTKVGHVLLRENYVNEAIIYFRAALRVDPSHLESLLSLSRVYLQQGWLREARDFAQAALELKPNLDEIVALIAEIDAARLARDEAPKPPLDQEDLPEVSIETIERIHHEYVEARKECGESVDELNLVRIARTLRREVARIRLRYPDAEVDFRVTVRDGKARIIARRAQQGSPPPPAT